MITGTIGTVETETLPKKYSGFFKCNNCGAERRTGPFPTEYEALEDAVRMNKGHVNRDHFGVGRARNN
jgi:hypothetical protein